nr:lysophospholipase [Saprospiraceae bacterium]
VVSKHLLLLIQELIMPSKKLRFTNSNGYELSARLDTPYETPEHYAIFAHCFTCSKNFKAVRTISKSLIANGFGVLRFDFTGLGESEGDFEDTNFTSNVLDLLCAAEYLAEEFGPPSIMLGHSLGGAATMCAANQLDFIKAYVTIAAPASPGHVGHFFEHHTEALEKEGKALVTIGGRNFTVKQQFLDDIKEQNIARILNESQKPILIFHSPQDEIVEIENATEIYKNARHPKSFISLAGADHMLNNEKDAIYVGDVTASWALRYLS